MKKNKIFNFIIFSLFIYIILCMNVSALEVSEEVEFSKCRVNSTGTQTAIANFVTKIYKLTGANEVYSFIFTEESNYGGLRYGISSNLRTYCDSTPPGFQYILDSGSSGTYSVTTLDTEYTYLYLSGSPDIPFTIEFIGIEEPPEEITFISKIYIPESDVYNKCYVVQNEDVIRAYDVIPASGIYYNYRDYYINSDYIYKDGSGTWSTYSTLPVCLSEDIITNDFYYRTDFYKILIMFLIISIFGIYLPLKIFSKLFRKGGL